MHRFLSEPGIAQYARAFGSTAVKAAVDDVLREARTAAGRGAGPLLFADLVARVGGRLALLADDGLVPVLNATGVLLHTNLGRAPLAAEALTAVAAIASGYSNLEFDLEAGTRGSRYARVTPLIVAATAAADALVVNNCAAAVLLALDTFARGREVVVARGDLIEIGGGFRLPDVLARSGATLVEVGTANKVRLGDFERALGPNTALILRTHASNFRIEGFTASVAPADVAALGRRAGVVVLEDLGSGALGDLAPFGLPHERTVGEAIADGIDLVAFSGDKLLGGPQAGIVAGSKSAIARMRANPLLRALRVDKATLAALAATLASGSNRAVCARYRSTPCWAPPRRNSNGAHARSRRASARRCAHARATPTPVAARRRSRNSPPGPLRSARRAARPNSHGVCAGLARERSGASKATKCCSTCVPFRPAAMPSCERYSWGRSRPADRLPGGPRRCSGGRNPMRWPLRV